MQPEMEMRAKLQAALNSGDPEAVLRIARELLATSDATEKLEHTERLSKLGQQAAELVHELRQPLLAVKGYAQLILERAADAQFVLATAETLVEQSARMERILERVRGYARRVQPAGSPAKTDVNTVVQAAISLLDYHVRKRRLTIETDLAGGLPPARADAVGLQQIVVNLLANARDALGAGKGTIRVRTSLAKGMVEIVVADDGPGVAKGVRGRLFEPFATAKPDGTGLGLAVSRRIAERAGGSLELVKSRHGATFRLRLPPA